MKGERQKKSGNIFLLFVCDMKCNNTNVKCNYHTFTASEVADKHNLYHTCYTNRKILAWIYVLGEGDKSNKYVGIDFSWTFL